METELNQKEFGPRNKAVARIRWPHAITLALAIFAGANVFGYYAINRILVPKDFRTSALGYTWRFLGGEANADFDSWMPMEAALIQNSRNPAEPLYQIFFKRGIKFQYPPSSLLVFDLIDHLSGPPKTFIVPNNELDLIDYAPEYHHAFKTANTISWLSIFALAVVVPVTYILALRKFSPALLKQFGSLDIFLQAAVLSFMTITFYPVTRGFVLGNIQTWLTLLFAGSILAWVCGYEMSAGILIGLIVTIKPQLVLLLLWALLRRRHKFFMGCATTIAVVEAIALWRYGLKNQIDYLSVLSFLSAHGESFYPNQSMNGLLLRMLHIGRNTEDTLHYFPPYNPLVYLGTLASSVLMIGWAFFGGWTKRDERSNLISFLAASLLVTMASPIAWKYHYGIMISIYACFLAMILGAGQRKQWLIWTAISYVLTSNIFLFTNMAADSRWNFIQSYLFAGAALLVFILYRYTAVAANGVGNADRAKVESDRATAVPVMEI